MDLKYVENFAKSKIDAYSLKKIDASVKDYLNEATNENIAKRVDADYQGIRKNYGFSKTTAMTEQEFWGELIKFWHYAESIRLHTQGSVPYSYNIGRTAVTQLLESTYGDLDIAYRIAAHESLGGLQAIIEAMLKKMLEPMKEKYIRHLIDKHLGKYKKSLHAVQYIAARYLLTYRPDLQESQFNDFMFCSYEDLERILVIHLEEYHH